MGKYLLGAPDEDLARWKADAAESGHTFAEYVRGALDHVGSEMRASPDTPIRSAALVRVRSPLPVAAAGGSAEISHAEVRVRGSTRQRSGLCEHRVPPGSFCKRCDD